MNCWCWCGCLNFAPFVCWVNLFEMSSLFVLAGNLTNGSVFIWKPSDVDVGTFVLLALVCYIIPRAFYFIHTFSSRFGFIHHQPFKRAVVFAARRRHMNKSHFTTILLSCSHGDSFWQRDENVQPQAIFL